MKDSKFTCVICEKEEYGWGNNPSPVKEHGDCCERCNREIVIPERLKRLSKTGANAKEIFNKK